MLRRVYLRFVYRYTWYNGIMYRYIVSSLRYMLGVCAAVMQDKPLACECGKPFSPGQAMRCRCCQGARTVCHDATVESGWRACVHKSGQASTREPVDNDLQGASFLDPAW